jgi:hypothetical protein
MQMGCDIHMHKEKFVGGKWVTADEWVAYDYGEDEKGMEIPWKNRFTDRNYDLFGLLAQVRRREYEHSFAPRGMPLVCSEEVREAATKWDGDGHSHSYLYLHELKELRAFLETDTMPVSGMKDAAELSALKDSIDAGKPDWNLLYPYCQHTNAPQYKSFSVEIPASFMVGDGVEKIISSFDGVDGDNHRIVFWFDN